MSWFDKSLRQKLTEANVSLMTNVQGSFAQLHDRIWKRKNGNDEQALRCLLGVKVGNEKLSFIVVEEAVNNLVEEYVPEKTDLLYKMLNEISALVIDVNENNVKSPKIKETIKDATDLVKELQSKFLEVEELRGLMLRDSDVEYFSLSVDPAELKVYYVIRYFFEVHVATSSTTKITKSPHKRSPKARDLLSFIDDDTTSDEVADKNNVDDNDEVQLDDLIAVDAYRSVPQSFMHIPELAHLYKLLVDLHDLVEYKEEDLLCENIEAEAEPPATTRRRDQIVKVIKAAALPTLGAVVGGVVGGPVGLMAGVKIGSYSTACATAAGITGSVVGYKSGKMMVERNSREES